LKQVIEELKTGNVRVVEQPVPRCGAHQLLVQNVASLISPGTEKLMIEMGKKNLVGKALARPDLVSTAYQKAKREGFLSVFREALARLDQPLPLGYSSAGIVVEVGDGVKAFNTGDSVACVGSGYAGHGEVVVVPEEMCTKFPLTKMDGSRMDYEEAAFAMLGAIAMQGLRCAEASFGENIVVIGLGLIGLLTVQICDAYGYHTIGIDINREKVDLARKLGCKNAFALDGGEIESTILNLTGGHGADSVILTAATKDNSPILLAEKVVRKRGKVVLVGVSDLLLTRKMFWDKELTFTVSKAAGPSNEWQGRNAFLPYELTRWTESRNLREFIDLIVAGSVNVQELITHRFTIEESPRAYNMILEGTESYIGVVIKYSEQIEKQKSILLPGRGTGTIADNIPSRRSLGVIGAGMFTKNILLPAAKEVDGIRFVGIASSSGLSSQHAGKRFGFEYATSDYGSLLEDQKIGSVFIATRHHLHAKMIIESLKAGKNVFVEKPLCITKEELDDIIEAYRLTKGASILMVGFNRVHSSLSEALKQALKGRTTPLQIQYRVNAGFIPSDHWTQDKRVGGGRIVGEVCHFINFLQFLTDSEPVEVYANSIRGSSDRFQNDDNVSLTLRFADGSLGTILYTALGSKIFSRERVEVFFDGAVVVLEDFRTLGIVKGSHKKKERLWSQDMGYRRELHNFFHCPAEQGPTMVRQAVATTLASLSAVESLRLGSPVAISSTGLMQ